jgi:hypothetical protein
VSKVTLRRSLFICFPLHKLNRSAIRRDIVCAASAHLPGKMHSVHTHSGERIVCIFIWLRPGPNSQIIIRSVSHGGIGGRRRRSWPKFLSEKCKKYLLVLAGSAESLMVRAAQQIGFTRWKISRRHSAKKIGCRLAYERCFKAGLRAARTPTSTQIITQRA